MQLLYTSSDLAVAQLVRVTLDREGIEYFCSDADLSVGGIGGPLGVKSRFYLLHDEDRERAVRLLDEVLTAPKTAVPSPVTRFPVWLLVLVVAVVVVVVGMAAIG
jgi:hypothetical protein